MHKTSLCLRYSLAVLAVVLWSGAVGGCTLTRSRQATEKDAPIRPEDVKVTAEQLRLRMRSLVGPMCGEIEQSADAISAGTPDPKVKLAALEWKMDAVPAMREALFRPDPYSAAFDTAALCMQMIEYFEHGPGKEALGPAASAQAAAGCRGMTDEYFKVVATATSSGDVSKARDIVQRWAADHPIRHSISGRESAMSRVYEQEFLVSRSAIEYVADAAATADDLTRKLDVLSDQLIRLARWELERLHLDQAMPLAERAVKSAEQAATTVDRLSPTVERSLSIAEDVPKIIASERETALKAVHDEITRTLQVVGEERETALRAVHDEITRTLQAVREERVSALEAVSKERGIASKEISEALSAQARQLTGDADLLATKKIDYTLDKVTRLVAISMAIAIGLVALVVVIWRWVVVSRQRRVTAGRIDTQLEA